MAIQLKRQNITNMYTPIELITTGVQGVVPSGGGNGVTNHGYLYGLGDNDHPQYLLSTRASTIYMPIGNSISYQLTSDNSLSLGTQATSLFLQSISSSAFIARTNSSLFQLTANNSLSLGTDDATAFMYVTNSTLFAASEHSHSDPTIVSTEGTNVTLASASDGLTIAMPAFITTAYGAAIQGSGSYTQNTGTISFANSNGVTFGLGTDGIMTASIPAIGGAQTGISGIADSAGTLTAGTLHFSNSNGIGFGLNGSTLTASYTVPGATVFSNSNNVEFGLNGSTVTALANFSQSAQTFSNQTSKYAFAGFSSSSVHTDGIPYGLSLTVQPGGNNLSLSGNTSGTLTIVSSGTAYLAGGNNITLSQDGNSITISGAVQGGVQTAVSGIGASNTIYTSGTVIWSGQNNVTIGSFVTSDSQYVRLSVGNYITTGAASDHTHGSNISFGNTSNSTESVVRASSSSNGLTMVVPAYLTTAALSQNTSNYAGINFGTAATGGSVLTATLNTSGLTLRVPAFITTAANSTHSHGNISLSLTNLSGTYSSASSGLTLSMTGYPATSFVNASETGNVYFSNGNGVSFGSATSGMSTTITADIATGSVYFVNSNSIVFGTSTSGNSTSISLSYDRSALAGTGVSSTIITGSVLGATLNTAGISLGLPAWMTTATGTGGGAPELSISAGTLSATRGSLVFSNSNNVSFGMNGSTITGSIPMGTVYFSDSNSFSFGSSVSGASTTVTGSFHPALLSFNDSNGITWGTSAGTATNITLITASVNAASGGAGTGTTVGLTTGSIFKMTLNSAGLDVRHPEWLTTAANSTHVHTPYAGILTTAVTGASATINSSQIQVNIPQGSVYYVDSNGVSFGASSSGLSTTITASVSVAGGGAGTGFTTGSTASGTNIAGTLNSNGLSIIYPSFLTTGGGAGNLSITAGTVSATRDAISFANSNGVSFGMDGSTITASVSHPTQTVDTQFVGLATTGITGGSATINSSQLNINIPVGTVYFSDSNGFSFGSSVSSVSTTVTGSFYPASVYFSDSNGISFGNSTSSNSNGSSTTVTASVQSMPRLSNFVHPFGPVSVNGNPVINGVMSIKYMPVNFNVTGTAFKIAASISGYTNTSANTASVNLSFYYGIYTLNGSTLSLASSSSANNSFQWSQSASTTANTSINGVRQITGLLNANITPGEYWVGAVISSQTTYTSLAVQLLIGNADVWLGNLHMAPIGSNTTVSSMIIPFQGVYTASTNVMPNSITKGAINFSSVNNVRDALFYNAIYNNTY